MFQFRAKFLTKKPTTPPTIMPDREKNTTDNHLTDRPLQERQRLDTSKLRVVCQDKAVVTKG